MTSRSLLAVRGAESAPPETLLALADVADEIGIDPDWLLAVVSLETGATFDPATRNLAGSSARGMIGFMRMYDGGTRYLGHRTEAEVVGMTGEEQARTMVREYFLPWKGRLHSLEDTYLAVLYPKLVGMSNSTVFARQEDGDIYSRNRGFDRDRDGLITRGEIAQTIRGVYDSAHGRRIVVERRETSALVVGATAFAVLGVGAAVAFHKGWIRF